MCHIFRVQRLTNIRTNSIHPNHKKLTNHIYLPTTEKPSCLQTTLASIALHPLLQIVPQVLLIQISTSPSFSVLPFLSLTLPFWHPMGLSGHLTPASWPCVQLTRRLLFSAQSASFFSVPVHLWKLSNQILPVPSPKWAPLSAVTPAMF